MPVKHTTKLDFPLPRSGGLDPPPIHRTLRDDRPVAEVTLAGGGSGYLVSRYEDVRTVLEDPRFSRAALSRADTQELVAYTPRQKVDPAESAHSMPYELLNRYFTPRAVARLRPDTERLAQTLLDRIAVAPQPVDLVGSLARVLPLAVIGEITGIPAADRSWIADRVPLVTVECPDAASRRASAEVFDYFRTALAARRERRTDDFLSTLLTAVERAPARIAGDRLVQMAMRTCLPGFHSVSVVLSKGIPLLLRQPDVYAALGARPELATPVVEEILRLTTPAATALPRLAVTDVDIAGVRIPAGSVVLGGLESANHDERRYPRPDRIDVEQATVAHMTFGRGGNFCFGAALSRMELEVTFGALAARLPGLRLAVPEDRLRFRSGVIAPDVLELPVRWQG